MALQFACQGTHGICVKGSVASVTRFERPRAVSHQQTLLMPHSSSPLSEPSVKELHTGRAPLGLGRHMQTKGLCSLETFPLLGKLKLTASASLQAAHSSAVLDVRTQAWGEQVLHAAFFQLKLSKKCDCQQLRNMNMNQLSTGSLPRPGSIPVQRNE